MVSVVFHAPVPHKAPVCGACAGGLQLREGAMAARGLGGTWQLAQPLLLPHERDRTGEGRRVPSTVS